MSKLKAFSESISTGRGRNSVFSKPGSHRINKRLPSFYRNFQETEKPKPEKVWMLVAPPKEKTKKLPPFLASRLSDRGEKKVQKIWWMLKPTEKRSIQKLVQKLPDWNVQRVITAVVKGLPGGYYKLKEKELRTLYSIVSWDSLLAEEINAANLAKKMGWSTEHNPYAKKKDREWAGKVLDLAAGRVKGTEHTRKQYLTPKIIEVIKQLWPRYRWPGLLKKYFEVNPRIPLGDNYHPSVGWY